LAIRIDGRRPNEIREVKITRNYQKYPRGSALIEVGNTKVICSASVEESVPPFLKNSGSGWITAEYSMLPASTQIRTTRESTRGRIGGRTHEIQRLIGRSMRAVVKLDIIGERTVWIDCDTIQADGGTRTASITGAFIALHDAIRALMQEGKIAENPLIDSIAAVSVGIVDGEVLLDLNYEEDSSAEVDMNLVMTSQGNIVEIQGTAEGIPFAKEKMDDMIEIATRGIKELTAIQKRILTDSNLLK